MIKPKQITAREVFKNHNWTFSEMIEEDGYYIVRAERKSKVKNQLNFFYGQVGKQYAEKLCKNYRNCLLRDLV